jgi:AraC-like DNA-binding protein
MGISFTELSEQYKDVELILVCLTDFQIKKDPFYYKAIFEYTNYYGNKKYPVAEIPPELFHKKYKIGAKFLNGVQIGYDENLSVSSFEINNPLLLNTFKMKDIINSQDYQIIQEAQINEYFLNQKCFFIQYNEYDLIIPHYAIANHFHFKSASLKNAILGNTFTYLYYTNTFKRDIKNPNKVHIKIKKQINISDIATICNFENNTIFFDSFKKYIHQRIKCTSKFGLHQVEAKFPFDKTLNIKTLCRQINTLGKCKILVLGIYQDDFVYDFNEVDYTSDESNGIQNLNITPSVFTKEKPQINKNKIQNKTPSAKYIINNEVFFENDFCDINEIRLNPIYIGVPNNVPLVINEVSQLVDGSYEKAKSNGDENLQEISSSSQTEIDKNIDLFPIEKFDILFKNLSAHNEVSVSTISNKISLITRENETNKIPSKYYIMSDITRCYKYGSFLFKDMKIAFIEIEAGGSWKKSTTWFFILPNLYYTFDTKNVNDIVFQYIGTENTLIDIQEWLKNTKNIHFFRKNHPDISLPEKAIVEWVKDVLYKYITPKISKNND